LKKNATRRITVDQTALTGDLDVTGLQSRHGHLTLLERSGNDAHGISRARRKRYRHVQAGLRRAAVFLRQEERKN
jgi:hypothetical protein